MSFMDLMKLLGEIFSRRLPEIPQEDREALCTELLHDRYIDINAAVDTVQRKMDELMGIQIAPQHAPFNAERARQIGSATADPTVPEETQQRRARSAPETATKAMHDDRMKAEADFRSRAGLKCYIMRDGASGCCKWCSEMAGRYDYGEEPDDVYRRHDNCGCSVTFENGRQRQDVWSKKTWEAPEPGAGAGEPVVLTAEQTENGGADKLHNFIGKIIPKKDLTILSEDDKIKLDKAYEYLSTVFANVDKNVHKLNPQLIIENAEQLTNL